MFRVGQEVAIVPTRGVPMRGTVERVTPTGRTVVVVRDRSITFDRTGREIGGSSSWGRDRVMPMTQAIANEIRHRELIDRLSVIRWKDVPLATLERVVAALEG